MSVSGRMSEECKEGSPLCPDQSRQRDKAPHASRLVSLSNGDGEPASMRSERQTKQRISTHTHNAIPLGVSLIRGHLLPGSMIFPRFLERCLLSKWHRFLAHITQENGGVPNNHLIISEARSLLFCFYDSPHLPLSSMLFRHKVVTTAWAEYLADRSTSLTL